MEDKKLSTDPYKGVRDFYPEDMAIQRYIFDVWSKTAESFGFARYDASVLEPSTLFKSKGAENEEMVNEQTYTFIDRGDREVTLRPEMTPTVARLVAGRRRELAFPLRWYSIPNLFRYERTQRGRLREHWQLNCDIFGVNDIAADVEIIAVAHQLLRNFGATEDMFAIQINNRAEMTQLYHQIGILDPATINAITKLTDRKKKIDATDYRSQLEQLVSREQADLILNLLDDTSSDNELLTALRELGITNARIDRTIARGFDYYTGTIFEIVDTHPDNNRSMLGGGRYDNLTGLFGGEAIPGIGFGMGDVTMRDFLETHNLLENKVQPYAPTLTIIPMEQSMNLTAQQLAHQFRTAGLSVATNISARKPEKKRQDAERSGSTYMLQMGEDELGSATYTVKNLSTNASKTGTIEELLTFMKS